MSAAVEGVESPPEETEARRTRIAPLGTDDLPRVAEWLARKANYQWLHFGPGRQTLDEVSLRFMMQRDLHLLRGFRPPDRDDPIGLVALSDVDRSFGTASVWYVLGEKGFGGRGHTTRAVARLLELAFDELGLGSVHAWTVETNVPSRRLLTRLGFRLMGRRRCCHRIDGVAYDRLLWDLLADEFVGIRPHRDVIDVEARVPDEAVPEATPVPAVEERSPNEPEPIRGPEPVRQEAGSAS